MPLLFQSNKISTGFTLAELLISLAILGVIATFSIPKILSAQANSANSAKAKETQAMIAAAYDLYKLNNPITSSVGPTHLTQYMNYLSTNTNAPMDDIYTAGQWDCSASFPCLRLHNGGLLRYEVAATMGGTNATNAIWFVFDPDGAYSGTTNGPGKAIMFFVYTNGRTTSKGNILANTCNVLGCFDPGPEDPPWFNW